MRKSFIVLVSFLVILFLSVLWLSFWKWDMLKNTFFSYSLIDIANYITTLIVGFFLTYIIAVPFQKEIKEKDILSEAIIEVQNDLTTIMEYLYKIKGQMITDQQREYILTLSKITDKDINFLMNMSFKSKVIEKNISNIVKIRGDFSFILTGDNLVTNQPIADVYIETCSLQYYQLKQQLMECRVNLYLK